MVFLRRRTRIFVLANFFDRLSEKSFLPCTWTNLSACPVQDNMLYLRYVRWYTTVRLRLYRFWISGFCFSDRIRQAQAKLQFHNPKRLKPEWTSVTAMPNKASLQLLLSAEAFYRIFVSFSFPFFSAHAVNTHLRAIYSPFEIVHIASLPSMDLRITEPCRRLCD